MLSPSTMKAVRESGAVPNAEYLLSVEHVRKGFPGVIALDDVQFKLKRAPCMLSWARTAPASRP